MVDRAARDLLAGTQPTEKPQPYLQIAMGMVGQLTMQMSRHTQEQFAFAVRFCQRRRVGAQQSFGKTDEIQILVPFRVPKEPAQHLSQRQVCWRWSKLLPKFRTFIPRIQQCVIQPWTGRYGIEKAP